MLVNLVSAVLLLASAIQALVIVSPSSGATLYSGANVILNVVESPNDTGVTAANIVITGPTGLTVVASIPVASFGTDYPVLIPATFLPGPATIAAYPYGATSPLEAVTDIIPVIIAPVPVPVFDNLYNYNLNINNVDNGNCNPCRSRCSKVY